MCHMHRNNLEQISQYLFVFKKQIKCLRYYQVGKLVIKERL